MKLNTVHQVLSNFGHDLEQINLLQDKDHTIDVEELEGALAGTAPKWAGEDGE